MSKREPVYLLLGPEKGDKDRFIDELRAAITKESGAAPDESRIYSFEKGLDEVEGLLRNGSLFGGHRLALYFGAEDVKKKAEIDSLKSLVERPARQATLVLLSDKVGVEKKVQDAVGAARKKIFWEMFEDRKPGWLKARMQREGLSLTPEAAGLILETVENTTDELERVCLALAGFLGRGAVVTEELVEAQLFHGKAENIFSLFDRIAAGDLAAAVESLRCQILSGEGGPVQVLAGLVRQFRSLAAYKLLLSRNYRAEEAFKELQVTSKRAQRALAAADAAFSHAEVDAIAASFADWDEELRSQRADMHGHLLELMLYTIMKRKDKRAFVTERVAALSP
jgi:DNA polymerase-3 subunit delta